MLKPFPFPAFLGSSELPDYELKFYLSKKRFLQHDGLEVEDSDKAKYVLHIQNTKDNPNNVIKLLIRDHREISLGAEHFYGFLYLPSVEYHRKEEPGRYTPWLKDRDKCILGKVELNTTLTEADIRKNPSRFRAHGPGVNFNGFWTEESVKARAMEVVTTYFPGFKLARKEGDYGPIKDNAWLIREPKPMHPPKDKTKKPREQNLQLKLF